MQNIEYRYNNQGRLMHGEYWAASVSTGLEMYDFDARFYDPQLGRWFVPDPAEQYPNGYLAIGNDPVNRIDPDGRHDRVSPFTGGPSFSGSGYNTSAFSWFSNNFFISYGGALTFTPPAPMRTWLYHPGGVAGALYRYEKHHWANNYGAHKGSFAPFSYRGQIYRYNSSRGGWGYEREYGAALGTSFHFVYFPNDPTPRVLTKPLFGIVNQWVEFGAQNGGRWSNSRLALDIGGGVYKALETATTPKGKWLGKNGKYNSNNWNGNQHTGSRSGAYKATARYKWAGRGALVGSAIIGGIQVYDGYQMDGGQFGYNSQVATGNIVGSLAVGWAGAEVGAAVGAAIGIWFGGIGAVPGAVIGGFIGGIAGGYSGGYIGEQAVKYYYY